MNRPPRSFEFVVPGKPQPAGSKRAYAKKGGGVIVTDDNPRAKPFQNAVNAEAVATLDGEAPLEGALRLTVVFILARPKGHYGSGRNSDRLRPSAPPFPTTRPDASKLVRAVEDALTGALFRDDAQIVSQHVGKRYGWPERTVVTVSEIEDAE